MTRVSVVMAAYNCATHLDRAVASVIAQTISDWELIIIDDASTDSTLATAQYYVDQDARIQVIAQPVNAGPSAARNAGLARAQGEWIAVLDADDAFRPTRLEQLLAAAMEHGADFVADNQIFIDDAAGQECGSAFPDAGGNRIIDAADLLISETRRGFKLGFMKPLIARRFLTKHALHYRTELRYAEDFCLYAELLLCGARAVLIDTPLYCYTTQMGQVSGAASKVSHTRFTPDTRLWIADLLQRDYGATMDCTTAESLTAYRRFSVTYALAHRMSELRHTGRVGALLGMMAHHPRGAWRFVQTLWPVRGLLGTGW